MWTMSISLWRINRRSRRMNRKISTTLKIAQQACEAEGILAGIGDRLIEGENVGFDSGFAQAGYERSIGKENDHGAIDGPDLADEIDKCDFTAAKLGSVIDEEHAAPRDGENAILAGAGHE